MKAFCIISVARQVDGEYIVVKVEKAFSSREKADAIARDLAHRYHENISMANGTSISCVCERGVFEIDIEE